MKNVKVFLSDVDGCLTECGMYYFDNGTEGKRFNVYDGMGMVLLQKAGVPCGIITSEDTEIVKRRAKHLALKFLYMGVGRVVDKSKMSKLDACKEICNTLGITLNEVCYIGDDVNDLDILSAVGFPACPQNAIDKVKALPNMLILSKNGGEGAVRELCDMILEAKTK